MRIRRFQGKDMTDALRQVRETLGPDAVILDTKSKRDAGGPRKGVIVMAAVDRHIETHPVEPPVFGRRDVPVLGEPHVNLGEPHVNLGEPHVNLGEPHVNLGEPHASGGEGPGTDMHASARPVPPPRRPEPSPQRPAPSPQGLASQPANLSGSASENLIRGDLEREVRRLQGRVFYLSRLITSDHFSAIPIPLRELYLDLVEAEVDSNLAFAILRHVAGENPPDIASGPELGSIRERLLPLLPMAVPIPARPGSRVVFLVGRPGSGKSTVAASLAARCLERGRMPGLVSLDTFRAGGPVGLEQYARILEVPFAIAFEPDDLLKAADERLGSCDLLLIDTPGLASGDAEADQLIRRFQTRLMAPEVHLVLPATAKVRDSAEALTLFAGFDLSSLIFTKLDLTASYGGILSLALKTGLPVTHLCWGRQVLRDLHDCSPEELLSLVLDRCASQSWNPPPVQPAADPEAAVDSTRGHRAAEVQRASFPAIEEAIS